MDAPPGIELRGGERHDAGPAAVAQQRDRVGGLQLNDHVCCARVRHARARVVQLVQQHRRAQRLRISFLRIPAGWQMVVSICFDRPVHRQQQGFAEMTLIADCEGTCALAKMLTAVTHVVFIEGSQSRSAMRRGGD